MKNSIIELLRFVFASIIVLFHASADAGILGNVYWNNLSFFKYGYLGVEFFFVVSGFLLAKKVFKTNSLQSIPPLTPMDIGLDTFQFIKGKVNSFFAVYVTACLLVSTFFIYVGKDATYGHLPNCR